MLDAGKSAGIGLAIGLVAGIVLIIVDVTRPDADPKAEAAASATPTAAPEPSGASPTAGELQWDQVGPEWFLVADVATYQAAEARDTHLELLSPMGKTYPVGDITGVPEAEIRAWFGDEVVFVDGDGKAGTYSLRTGEVRSVDATSFGGEPVESDGKFLLVPVLGESSSWKQVVDPATLDAIHEYCDTFDGPEGGADSIFSGLSPAGDSELCVAPLNSGGSDVIVTTFPKASKSIQKLRLFTDKYRLHGWADGGHVYLSRAANTGSGRSYFTIDANTGDVASTDAPLPATEKFWTFDPGNDVFVSTRRKNTTSAPKSVAFYDGNGELVTEVKCELDDCDAQKSGKYYAVTEYRWTRPDESDPNPSMRITLVSLQDGVVSVAIEGERPYGEHLEIVPYLAPSQ